MFNTFFDLPSNSDEHLSHIGGRGLELFSKFRGGESITVSALHYLLTPWCQLVHALADRFNFQRLWLFFMFLRIGKAFQEHFDEIRMENTLSPRVFADFVPDNVGRYPPKPFAKITRLVKRIPLAISREKRFLGDIVNPVWNHA
jgi:hypothetical protein